MRPRFQTWTEMLFCTFIVVYFEALCTIGFVMVRYLYLKLPE